MQVALFFIILPTLFGSAWCKMSKNAQKKYLKRLGYMDEVSQNNTSEDQQLKKGVSLFQETWDLPVTGELNEDTEKLMNQKRCGTSDSSLIKGKGKGRRSKRYAIFGGAWPKTDLTYRIVNVSSIKTSNSATPTQIRQAIADAFAVWSAETPLRFTSTSSLPDIDIYFAQYEHCEGGGFDGSGGTLAHAYSPRANFVDDAGYDYAGDAHFDDGEDWTLNVASGNVIDVFLVAVHEFGHSLGLGHSRTRGAIMYPYYAYQSSFQLARDDIDGIQSLYGGPVSGSTSTPTTPSTTPNTTPTTPTTPSTTAGTATPSATPTSTKTTTTSNPNNKPSFCDDASMDAMTEDITNNIFVFKGTYYAVVGYDSNILAGYPRRIQDDFPELPTSIDAAVYVPDLYMGTCNSKGKCRYSLVERKAVYLFKSGTYYKYKRGKLRSRNFVKSGSITSEFGTGLPNKIDTVFTFSGLSLHFTSGDNYWRVTRGKSSPSVDTDISYPASLSSRIVGLPSTGIDSSYNAIYYSSSTQQYNSINDFFIGSQFYRVTDGNAAVDTENPPYPRSTAKYFFKCDSSGISVGESVKGNSKSGKSNSGKGKSVSGTDNKKTQQKAFVDENNKLISIS